MFNVHTSMTAANEEIQKLSTSNSKLIERNEHLEFSIVNIEALKKKWNISRTKLCVLNKLKKFLEIS